MNDKLDKTNEKLGLLAIGSSAGWDIAVDESLHGDEWSIEIDGPQIYFVFALQDLKAVPAALRFLQTGLQSHQAGASQCNGSAASLTLGRFGPATVSLVWDNEDFPRCFLIVGPEAQATVRLALEAEDIKMWIEALQQVVEELPAE